MHKKMNLNGSKIIIHNLTTRAVDRYTPIFNFDQRGLVYAAAGDTVITRRPIDPEYLDYLAGLEWPMAEVELIHPAECRGSEGYRFLLNEPEVVSRAGKHPGYIDTYHLTMEERRFALATGRPLYGRPEIAQRYGTKSGFASLCAQLGVPIPPGYSGLREADQVIRSLESLFLDGARVCVIKEDEGTASYGSTVVERKEFERLPQEERYRVINAAIHKVVQINIQSSVRVEMWVEDVVSSPSIQMQILPDGGIIVNSTHDQILYGREQEYIGASFPCRTLEGEAMSSFTAQAAVIAAGLAERSYIGFFGLDTVYTRQGDIYWVDANLRKPGTFYPRVVIERLRGGLENCCYYSRDFHLGRGSGYTFRDIYDALGGAAYDSSRGIGAVIYNIGALPEEGRVDIVAVGGCADEARHIYGRTCAAIEPLALPGMEERRKPSSNYC